MILLQGLKKFFSFVLLCTILNLLLLNLSFAKNEVLQNKQQINKVATSKTNSHLLTLATDKVATSKINNHESTPGTPYIPFSYSKFKTVSQYMEHEYIDTYLGHLRLVYDDINIPGNGGLDIKIRRNYDNFKDAYTSDFNYSYYGVGWDLGQVMIQYSTATVCSYSSNPLIHSACYPILTLPDGQREVLYPSSDDDNHFITKSKWKAQKSGGGFIVFAPNGTQYGLTHVVDNIMAVPDWVKDVHGNWLHYSYLTGPHGCVTGAISSITSSDGRKVNFNYTRFAGGYPEHLVGITANNHTWKYDYIFKDDEYGNRHWLLTQVTLPDGLKWKYSYAEISDPWWYRTGRFNLVQVVHPQGGVTNYSYGMPGELGYTGAPMRFLAGKVLMSKTNTGSNIVNGTWHYSYNWPTGINGMSTFIATVAGPTGRRVFKYFNMDGWSEKGTPPFWENGLLIQEDIYNNGQSTSVEARKYSWGAFDFAPGCSYKNDCLVDSKSEGSFCAPARQPILQSESITRDGTTYVTSYSNYNSYGDPTKITKTDGAGNHKETEVTYFSNPSKWVIDKVQTKIVNGLIVGKNSYDNNGDLIKSEKFDVPTTYTYDVHGNITSVTNAINEVTQFSDFVLGIPKKILYPDGSFITQVVNDTGTIASVTDCMMNYFTHKVENDVTMYEYDALNRVTKIVPPINAVTHISYNGDAGAGGQTITRGNSKEIIKVDGFGRPIEQHKIDLSTGKDIVVYKKYDSFGRLIFKSYPVFGFVPLSTVKGVFITYDALNRITSTTEPSPYS